MICAEQRIIVIMISFIFVFLSFEVLINWLMKRQIIGIEIHKMSVLINGIIKGSLMRLFYDLCLI